MLPPQSEISRCARQTQNAIEVARGGLGMTHYMLGIAAPPAGALRKVVAPALRR